MDPPTDDSTQMCDNCKKQVSQTNFSLHSVHCQRNICLCDICKEPYPKNEIKDHINEAHAKISCEKCGQQIERQDTEKHKVEECTNRLVKCNFCELEIPFCDEQGHLDFCGSRTERCETCGRYVMLKFMDIHLSSNHIFLSMDALTKESKTVQPPNVTNFDLVNDVNPVDRLGARFAEDLTMSRPILEGPEFVQFPPPHFPNSLLDDIEYAHGHAFDDLLPDAILPTQTFEDEFESLLTFDHRNASFFPHRPRNHNTSNYPFLATDEKPISRSPEIVHREDRIPCEICGELIDFNLLMDHQDNCEEDRNINTLPRLNHETLPETLSTDESPVDYDLIVTSNITLIPCEYCNKPFDADFIIEHQTGCIECQDVVDVPRHPPPPPPRIAQPSGLVDEEMDYINDLFLKEAIENSLKGQNQLENHDLTSKRIQKTNILTATRSPKIRNIPIKVESPTETNKNGSQIPVSTRTQANENGASGQRVRESQTTGTRPKSVANSQISSSPKDTQHPKPPARRRPPKDQ